MPTFSFDSTLSTKDNIEKFLAHLDTIDLDMSSLLRANISSLLPLPEGLDRSTRRTKFNQAISAGLDSLSSTPAEPKP